MTRTVEVWIDADVSPLSRVGLLHDDRGQIRFHYDQRWIAGPHAFSLDPDLSLDAQPFFPRPETGNFGVFLDSSPDRWGQTLMKRREALAARDDGRSPRTLRAWDFLLGVQDLTRQGALRFRDPANSEFLANERLAAPPSTSLRELEAAARELTNRRVDRLDLLRQWLKVLVAPGASLGGARPKANFSDPDGSLWIGKFPARDDTYDQGAWEYLIHELADRAEIDVPEARMLKFSDFHTFCVKRFDRQGPTRRFYASAMTMLRKTESEGTSYLELAQFLQNHGDPKFIASDLETLFRRVVFFVMTGNRDDHLRNHGFLLDNGGWRLAPAFDVNPHPDKDEHVLALDDQTSYPEVDTVIESCEFYRLDRSRALELAESTATVIDSWPSMAKRAGLQEADRLMIAPAFSAHTSYRATNTGTRRRGSQPRARSSR